MHINYSALNAIQAVENALVNLETSDHTEAYKLATRTHLQQIHEVSQVAFHDNRPVALGYSELKALNLLPNTLQTYDDLKDY